MDSLKCSDVRDVRCKCPRLAGKDSSAPRLCNERYSRCRLCQTTIGPPSHQREPLRYREQLDSIASSLVCRQYTSSASVFGFVPTALFHAELDFVGCSFFGGLTLTLLSRISRDTRLSTCTILQLKALIPPNITLAGLNCSHGVPTGKCPVCQTK